MLYVCKREGDGQGREYPAVYKLSDALAKRISEVNTQESPKDQKTPLALIKKTLPRCLIVLCKRLLLNCGFGIILRPVKGLIRNKDPPMTDRKKSGATVYENLGFIVLPALLGGAAFLFNQDSRIEKSLFNNSLIANSPLKYLQAQTSCLTTSRTPGK